MTGMDWILCKVLWILHLSMKIEAENTVLLAEFYEITAWGIHFWGYMYISVSVYERERERGTTQVFWGRQAICLLDSQRSSRVRTHLSGPLNSQASSFPLWIPEAIDWPQDTCISFILSPDTPQQLQSWKASLTPPFITCMLSGRPLLSGPQLPHMSHDLIRVTALWGCCRIKPVITWKCLEQSVNVKVGAFIPSSRSQENEPWTAHGLRNCKSKPQATLWVSEFAWSSVTMGTASSETWSCG